jgi:hypothetical protein
MSNRFVNERRVVWEEDLDGQVRRHGLGQRQRLGRTRDVGHWMAAFAPHLPDHAKGQRRTRN